MSILEAKNDLALEVDKLICSRNEVVRELFYWSASAVSKWPDTVPKCGRSTSRVGSGFQQVVDYPKLSKANQKAPARRPKHGFVENSDRYESPFWSPDVQSLGVTLVRRSRYLSKP